MRLIDADRLKKQIHCAYSDDLGILEEIDAQPTAYDVGKVVAELENLADKANDKIMVSESPQYHDGYEDGVRQAIQIVKGGGVDGY